MLFGWTVAPSSTAAHLLVNDEKPWRWWFVHFVHKDPFAWGEKSAAVDGGATGDDLFSGLCRNRFNVEISCRILLIAASGLYDV
jgi:hypothetical protein